MQIRLGLLPAVIFFSIFSPVYAANFTFTFGQPTQCDNFPVSWSGMCFTCPCFTQCIPDRTDIYPGALPYRWHPSLFARTHSCMNPWRVVYISALTVICAVHRSLVLQERFQYLPITSAMARDHSKRSYPSRRIKRLSRRWGMRLVLARGERQVSSRLGHKLGARVVTLQIQVRFVYSMRHTASLIIRLSRGRFLL